MNWEIYSWDIFFLLFGNQSKDKKKLILEKKE